MCDKLHHSTPYLRSRQMRNSETVAVLNPCRGVNCIDTTIKRPGMLISPNFNALEQTTNAGQLKTLNTVHLKKIKPFPTFYSNFHDRCQYIWCWQQINILMLWSNGIATNGLIVKERQSNGSCCSLTVLHHDGEEAHNDFGAGPDENLALAAFLRIVDAFQRIGKDVHAHHDACKTPHRHKKR